MIFAALLAITGLTISAVAIYYSVIGLTAIFAAAFWPVIVMGVTLEAAKLVAASWLKAEWHRIPKLLKSYLTVAVVILMMITSMGIFGFLSKAHLDQNIISGDVVDKVAIIDEKIKTQRDNIEAARKALRQMDEAVDQTMSRSTSEQGADKAAALRRAQARERNQLQGDITKAQAEIAKLNNERAPIAKELRKVEAEVGPIKYIAKLIYGDNPDQNILEKAVTWVIIMIVVVFDPLAVLLLISSQMAYQWYRQEKKSAPAPMVESSPEPQDTGYVHSPWPFSVNTSETDKDFKFLADDKDLYPDGKDWEKNKIDEANSVAAEVPPALDVDLTLASADQQTAEEIKLTVDSTNKTADGADLYDQGKIDQLPKEVVEKFDDEKLEEDSKKKDILHDQRPRTTDQEDQRPVGYIQNAEQGENTLWQRIQKKDQLRAIDRLYKEYSDHEFRDIVLDKNDDPEFLAFVERIKTKGPRFSNYSPETLEKFAQKIYEIKENQSKNNIV